MDEAARIAPPEARIQHNRDVRYTESKALIRAGERETMRKKKLRSLQIEMDSGKPILRTTRPSRPRNQHPTTTPTEQPDTDRPPREKSRSRSRTPHYQKRSFQKHRKQPSTGGTTYARALRGPPPPTTNPTTPTAPPITIEGNPQAQNFLRALQPFLAPEYQAIVEGLTRN